MEFIVVVVVVMVVVFGVFVYGGCVMVGM